MFIDTSAVVAILAGEPEAAALLAAIEATERRESGAHVRLEARINGARIPSLAVMDARDMDDAFLAAAGITAVSISDAIARRAVEAFDRYGKG